MTDRLLHELRYALRALRGAPGFSAGVLVTLALAFAGSVAIFGVFHSIFLRPLPFADSGALVVVESAPTTVGRTDVAPGVSYPNYQDLLGASRHLRALAAYAVESPALSSPGLSTTTVRAGIVSASFFETMVARPLLGRVISPEEDVPNGPRVVVLAHELWSTRFGSDPGVLGRQLVLDGTPHSVIGVMSPGFAFPERAQLWTALGVLPGTAMRGMHALRVVGRLADSDAKELTTPAAELRALALTLAERFPRENGERTLRVRTLADALTGDARPALLALSGAIATLWLIACLNVAGLVIARAAAGKRDVAVRIALGGGAGRIASRYFVEAAVLALVAAGGGLALAVPALRALEWLVPVAFAGRVSLIAVPILGAFGCLVLLTAALIGVAPTAMARGLDPGSALRGSATGSTRGVIDARFGRALVVAELSLAVVLLFGAGLLARSLQRLSAVQLGFEPERVTVVTLRLPPATYGFAAESRVRAFYTDLLEQLEALPEVRAAAVAMAHPLQTGFSSSFELEGMEGSGSGRARMRPVSPGYFTTVGLRLLEGRAISSDDRAGGAGAVVVNREFVRQYLRDGRAVGRELRRQAFFAGMPARYAIVGVVDDERFGGPRSAPEPATYFAFEQVPFASASVVVATREEGGAALSAALRERVAAVDRDVAVDEVRSLDALLADTIATPSSMTALVGAFAALALLLAVVGLYGLLTFTAAARRYEVAVRLALGAAPTRLLLGTVAGGAGLAMTGLAVGFALGAGGVRLLAPFLFDVSFADPVACLVVAALLLGVAIIATLGPAVRIARVSPMLVLRGDG